jgi:1,4-alpha-glucan branching enzyme
LRPLINISRCIADDRGYFSGILEYAPEDYPEIIRYFYRLDKGKERPDPASRFQPEGVHGPSAVTGESFAWTDGGWAACRFTRIFFMNSMWGRLRRKARLTGLFPIWMI